MGAALERPKKKMKKKQKDKHKKARWKEGRKWRTDSGWLETRGIGDAGGHTSWCRSHPVPGHTSLGWMRL